MPKLYGQTKANNAIPANQPHITFRDTELAGWLELLGIMVAPDYDPADASSNLDIMRILVADKQILFDFKVNYYANMLPWVGIHPSPNKVGMCVFSPSVKIQKGKKLEFQFYAGASAVDDPYYVRPVGYLYREDELPVAAAEWEAQPGGINQGREKIEPFVKFGYNESATTPGEWYDIDDLSFRIYAHQELTITHIGLKPHDNLKEASLADIDRTLLATEYPFGTNADFNELPFGNAWQDSGPYAFPEVLRPVISDDFIRVRIRDKGTAVPANGVIVQVRGSFRTQGGG